ncbi:velvet factor-domain-containing protein [Bombardia bombarda]|uniref:Velvet factor-domain-containing protein n=1 Tax=Bombardia bombarda TaxID=252184 RepID=A0AA39X824_9PEZI|nr:velvet factor-domain-containing protein [Bombardia bombarda]
MPAWPVSEYQLVMRQQPKYARVAIGKEKDRKPIDPPPIVQLRIERDTERLFLQNPYLILTARLIRSSSKAEDSSPEERQPQPEPKENDLVGTVVSSLYSLKDTTNVQGGFFVFGDLSVRKEGNYKLEFNLYELKLGDRECWMLSRCISDEFVVYPQKYFPGMAESTFLTRSFSDQGVRLRLRKDSRSVTTRKRNVHVAQHVSQFRSQTEPQYDPNNNGGQLSPHSQSHLRRASIHDPGVIAGHMERNRGSLGSQGGGYFSESPQLRQDYGAPSYSYSTYDDNRAAKRMRSTIEDDNHNYNNTYTPYTQTADPRTLPEAIPLSAPLYPSSNYPVSSLPAMSNLPMPSNQSHHFAGMPRLDTQLSPQSAGPNSAASIYPSGARRSSGSPYQFQGHQQPMYTSPPTNITYHAVPTTAMSHGHGGLGIALPTVDSFDGVDKQNQGGL